MSPNYAPAQPLRAGTEFNPTGLPEQPLDQIPGVLQLPRRGRLVEDLARMVGDNLGVGRDPSLLQVGVQIPVDAHDPTP